MNNCLKVPKNKYKGADLMKKLLIVTGFMALICILITSNSSSFGKTPETVMSSPADESLPSGENEADYIIKAYNRRLAVFEQGQDEPVFISNVYISELPDADRELIKTGICAHSKKELNRLLEDYCS